MTVYAVQLNRDGLAEQASMPVMISILSPQIQGWVVIKANQGRGESLREEEMTSDDDGEREASKLSELDEAPATHLNKATKVKGRTPRTRLAHVPKQAEVIILDEVRRVPCDWCRAKAHKCYSQTKGGQPLNICVRCHRQKLSFRTGGMECQKKVAKVPDDKDPESSESDEESDESRRGWLAKFSTVKVGPPKGTRCAMG